MPESSTGAAGVEALAAAIALPTPAPAAGAALGAVSALAAALVEKACALTADDALVVEGSVAAEMRDSALEFAELDEHAFGGIAYARSVHGDVAAAWAEAARVPLELADGCATLIELATGIAELVNPNLRGEVDAAITLSRAAGLAAARLAEIDLTAAGPTYVEDRERLAAVRTLLAR
ncbi:MAG TPA: cyclodeaminase/cyclohydrolase family protein [Gaiellales bacterium]|jgi:formiminotetrahydrofolate cyclodeaminase